MITIKADRSALSLLLILASSALFACGGDDPTILTAPPGSGGTGSTPSGNAGTGGINASAGTGGTSAGGTGGSSAACVEEPSTAEEFLVRCTDSACRPFDNAARLSLYRAGEPLPEVP